MTEKLWGGRFAEAVDPTIHHFTASLPFDRRLVRQDLIGSLAHARMLGETGVLEPAAARAILAGLGELLGEVEAGRLAVEGPDEDVHSWIERQLAARIGSDARRLHTARSRNDQVSTALRLYTREAIEDLLAALGAAQDLWLAQAEAHRETWLPGYTHLQRGQPISLAHQLLAHFWALEGDARRLRRAHRLAGVSPLGAGALAGTPWPIDPRRSAVLLGFPRVYPNSLHAVADRDFVVEAAFACALLMVHLSRWAEEVVLWTSAEFGFASLEDRVAKGSSLMPQKRNPEAAEILRGKSGRAIGQLTALLVMLKGLPLAYNSDLQEDKEALFESLDTARGALGALPVLAGGLRFHPERMAAALRGGFLTATDLADHLVAQGLPFREAHQQAGRAVRLAEAEGIELWELAPAALAEACPGADPAILPELRPERAVLRRAAGGGPAPAALADQLALARRARARLGDWLGERRPPPIYRDWRAGRLLEGLAG